MENNTFGVLLLEVQGVEQMPCNGLSLAVLIGCQPYGVRFFCKALEFRNNFLLVV